MMTDRRASFRGMQALGIGVLATVAASINPGAPAAPSGDGVEIRVRVDRGEDLGQNFGSLFEARTRDGAFVLGAGFLGSYNTYYRSDRHTVHFFIRPTGQARHHTSEELPRPGNLAGTYLFSRDGKLYAADPEVRVWHESETRWEQDALRQRGRMRLGNDLLLFDGSRLEFNGNLVLTEPAQGSYHSFYYAHGHVFFYHTFWADQRGYRPHTTDAEGYTKLYACPWRPGHDEKIDLTKAVVMTLPIVGELPFSYGQLGDDVLTCSSIGGLYAYSQTRWRTVLEGDTKTSYQVYSMLNFCDRLIMGQYPTGELFEFNGETVTRLEGWPPRMPGVQGNAREAQTTTLYGGDLFVGVWPWGELWRYRPDAERWTFVRRMFTHPSPTDQTTHPYEDECAALGGVINQWGQRVTSLVTLGPSLIVSTSAKHPCEWEPKFDFIAEDKWKEYGAVTRLTIPGHLSASLAWTDGPTELRFVVNDGGTTIIQDGRVAARGVLTNVLSDVTTSTAGFAETTWGSGMYGAFGGSTLHGEIRTAPHPISE